MSGSWERKTENENKSGGRYTPRTGSRAIFYVDDNWLKDELLAENSEIVNGIARVEISLRGSLILGENGKALDGEFIANEFPTGNRVEGGDFVSCFPVSPRS